MNGDLTINGNRVKLVCNDICHKNKSVYNSDFYGSGRMSANVLY